MESADKGSIKGNVDGATTNATTMAVAEGFIGACSFPRPSPSRSKLGFFICHCMTQVANKIGIHTLVLKIDSNTVVSKLCDEEKDRSIFRPIVEEIKSLFHAREECGMPGHEHRQTLSFIE